MRRTFQYVDYDNTVYRAQPALGYLDWDQNHIWSLTADDNELAFVRFGINLRNSADRIFIKGADGEDYVLGVNPDNWQEFEWFHHGIASRRETGDTFAYLNPTDRRSRRLMSFDDTIRGRGTLNVGHDLPWSYNDRLYDRLTFSGNLPDYSYLVKRTSRGFARIRTGQDVWQFLALLPAPVELSDHRSPENYIHMEDGRWNVHVNYISDEAHNFYPEYIRFYDLREVQRQLVGQGESNPLKIACASPS